MRKAASCINLDKSFKLKHAVWNTTQCRLRSIIAGGFGDQVALRRNRVFIGTVAVLLGAGLILGIESATQWSPVSHVSSVPRSSSCTMLRSPAGAGIEVCVEPVPVSASDDFIRSILAAFVGGLLGVGTYIAGQASVGRKEKRSGQVAVRVTRKELQENRLAMNNALNPTPPGTSPPPERIATSVFRELRIQLADRLPYELFTRTSRFYERLAGLASRDLRQVDRHEIESLRDESESLDNDLRPYDIDQN